MVELRGIIPVVYTPFDAEGRVVEDDLERLVEHLIAAGAHGLAAVGGASEAHKLTVEERMRLAERTIGFARGRVLVIVGTSATNTSESVELSRHAEGVGADAVFVTPPLFGAMTAAALDYHYGTIARAVEIPVMMQDALMPIAPEAMVRLAETYPNLCYVKEEVLGESGHRISELRRLRPELTVLSGGSYLLEELARGAAGAIPGSIGVADLCRAYDCFVRGDAAGARAAFDRFTPLAFWRLPFPLIGAKEVLRRLGVFSGAYLREPAGPLLDEQDHRELSAIMEAMGEPY